jgi:hypothetical protein
MAVTRRTLLGLLAVGLGGATLSGCGRKGRPHEPEDAVYPRIYPYTPYPAAPAPAPAQAPAAPPRAPSDETDLPQ